MIPGETNDTGIRFPLRPVTSSVPMYRWRKDLYVCRRIVGLRLSPRIVHASSNKLRLKVETLDTDLAIWPKPGNRSHQSSFVRRPFHVGRRFHDHVFASFIWQATRAFMGVGLFPILPSPDLEDMNSDQTTIR